jgi:hypothetical protein
MGWGCSTLLVTYGVEGKVMVLNCCVLRLVDMGFFSSCFV